MKSISFLIIILGLGSHSLAAEPSSAIPDKREFPLSAKYKACDDFHKYVCDEVESSFKLRDDRSRHVFSFNDSSERLLEAKKKFFGDIQNEKKLLPRGQQIKDFYLACMDSNTGAKAEKNAMKKKTAEIEAIQNIGEFKKLQFRNIPAGEPSLIHFGTNSNQERPEVADALLLFNLMNLPEFSYYENAELMKDYKKLVKDFFKKLNPKQSEKQLEQRADRLISLETDFVKIYPHPQVQRQRWTEPRQQSQKEFLQKYSRVGFADVLTTLPPKSQMFNPYPEAIDFLNEKLTAENLEVFKDAYLYKTLAPLLDDSSPEYFNEQFQFKNKYLGGPKARSLRDERCTRTVMDQFPKELDQLMIPKLFPSFPTEKFGQIIEKVRESIIAGVKKNSWLGSETQAKAILKIKKMRLYLVQPRNDREWDFLPVIKFSPKNKIENQMRYAKIVYQRDMLELKKGINLEGWGMGPLTVNAYYDPTSNKFVMPLGILQYPFFDSEGGLVENLGTVGAVAGHEMGHGIDDQGSKFDENGKVHQWMTMKDLAEFSSRGQKLIGFFDRAGHNGTLTLGENIGDLVGLTFAYRAAFGETKPTAADQQKFYVGYGRLWCAVTRPKDEEKRLKTDPHALGWARINEQVKHQKNFADAFGCKSGDAMYLPESEQVKIW